MAREDRFEKVFEQGMVNVTEIWVDRVTGVQYVFHASGYAGGSFFTVVSRLGKTAGPAHESGELLDPLQGEGRKGQGL